MNIAMLRCFIAALFLSGVRGHDHFVRRETTEEVRVERCGTVEPRRSVRESTQKALALSNLKAKAPKRASNGYRKNSPKVVPVCFHFPRTTSDSFYLTRQEIEVNLEVLNKHFGAESCCDESLSWCNGECSSGGDTGFRFEIARKSLFGRRTFGTTQRIRFNPFACITRKRKRAYRDWIYDEDAAEGDPDTSEDDMDEAAAIKHALRRGDASVLNVYVLNLGDNGLLGYATFPPEYEESPLDDGVIINTTTVVGGMTIKVKERAAQNEFFDRSPPFLILFLPPLTGEDEFSNMGGTLSHEIGT